MMFAPLRQVKLLYLKVFLKISNSGDFFIVEILPNPGGYRFFFCRGRCLDRIREFLLKGILLAKGKNGLYKLTCEG